MDLARVSRVRLRMPIVVVLVGLLVGQRDVHRRAALRRPQLQGDSRRAVGRHAEECTLTLIHRLGHIGGCLRNGGGDVAGGVEQDPREQLGEIGVAVQLVVMLVLRVGR